ncbi:hypothetical protein HMPREF9237_00597 [Actinotignum schaalii FB123-CNA-2]|uniref:Uncharacterized protein n=1 Tax=Actinotignum schaalii FB123-CNA-2 TaxID=883067 RepID=S2VMK5_9ACTO|nr:hypothetical protein HMPREF9237_00597 [Actinotignum schaalii FB123-CNA-2]
MTYVTGPIDFGDTFPLYEYGGTAKMESKDRRWQQQ